MYFKKQHGEDKVFINRRIDRSAEGITGIPHSFVDFALIDWEFGIVYLLFYFSG